MVDNRYLEIILTRLAVCKAYQPKFGQSSREGLSLSAFVDLYSSDPLYHWLGLDSPVVYAAHRAAGGMTSIYRQIGIGCEMLVRQILIDNLGLSDEEVRWSYRDTSNTRSARVLNLDARIDLVSVRMPAVLELLKEWVALASNYLDIQPTIAGALRGAVFEVRQGYKSKDAKRQNADLSNAAAAYARAYLLVMMMLSTQFDSGVVERYRHGKWLVLEGILGDDPLQSTYAFMDQVIGYDLAGFFERNATQFRAFVAELVSDLLHG